MNGGRGIHLALGFHSFVVPGATKHDWRDFDVRFCFSRQT